MAHLDHVRVRDVASGRDLLISHKPVKDVSGDVVEPVPGLDLVDGSEGGGSGPVEAAAGEADPDGGGGGDGMGGRGGEGQVVGGEEGTEGFDLEEGFDVEEGCGVGGLVAYERLTRGLWRGGAIERGGV